MENHVRPAILLPEEPFGVLLLRREHERQENLTPGGKRSRHPSLGDVSSQGHQKQPSAGSDVRSLIKCYVREGASLPGGDASVEEVAVLGHRVAWTSGYAVRKLFTLGAEVLHATWAIFPGHSTEPVLCLLCANCCLVTCTIGGELHESAVPPGMDAVRPAGDCGVLLEGTLAATVYLLSHPMDEPQPVIADVSLRAGRRGSYAGWSGEQMLWSSYELRYLATYSEAAGRLAIWMLSRAPLAPELLGNLPDIPAATPLGGAAVSGAVTLTGLAGGGRGAPPTGMSAATAVTPISMMSMFSFKPHVPVVGAAPPSACPRGAGGMQQSRGSGPMAPPGAALVTPHASGSGGGLFPTAQPHQYCPPSAAPSDMSMAFSPAIIATATPPGMFGAAGQHRPPLPHTHSQQQHHLQHGFLQHHVSPYYPPSAAPSDMSIGYTPAAIHGSTPQTRNPHPLPPQQSQLHPQHAVHQPSPSCPPSAAPSDMSMSASMSIASGHTDSRGTGLGCIATITAASDRTAALAATATGPPGRGAGRFHSPYGSGGGIGGASPMMMSPWMATVSPGPGFGVSSAPGTAFKRHTATRTPDGFLSPHLFNPVPRATAVTAAASLGGHAYLSSALSPGPTLGHHTHHHGRGQGQAQGHSQWRPAGTPFSQVFGDALRGGLGSGGGAAGAAAPVSTPGLLGATAGGRLGSRTHLTGAPRSGHADPTEECTVMVLLHEETLQPGCRPTTTVMATDLHGAPLLCVLCGQQSRVLAFSISISYGEAASVPGSRSAFDPATGATSGAVPTGVSVAAPAATAAGYDSGGGVRVSLAGTLDAVAVAAVTATGIPITSPSSPFRVHRDLLALLPSGQLVLHRGMSPLFAVSYGDPGVLVEGPRGSAAASTLRQQSQPSNTPVSAVYALFATAGGGGVRNVFGAGGVPSTPASAAGTDMMVDDGSDMDQDIDDERVGGGGLVGGGSSGGTPPALRNSAAAARFRAIAVRSDDAMSEVTDDDDMMLLSSPPAGGNAAAGPSSAAVAAAVAAASKSTPASGRASHIKRGGAGRAGPGAIPCDLFHGVSNTVVVGLAVPTGQCQGIPSDGKIDSKQGPLATRTTLPSQQLQPRMHKLRLLLPFTVTSAIASLALEVIRAAAPSELYLTFLRRFYSHQPAATRRAAGEWAAVDAVLLEWANDPPAFADAGRAAAAAAAATGSRFLPLQHGRRSGGGGLGVRSPSSGDYSSGHGAMPTTPFSTPLHTRRFAAMSLASPVGQQQPPPHQQQQQQQQQRQVQHFPQPTMQRPTPRQQLIAGWADAADSRRAGGDGNPAGAVGPGPGSAWERLLASETQARLISRRRKPIWMTVCDPSVVASTATSAAQTSRPLSSLHTLLGDVATGSSGISASANATGEDDSSANFPPPPLGPAAQPLLAVLYGLHGLYEELKLDVLSWPLLQPLGSSLAAVASVLGLHAYWEHYARDLGPATLVAAGAPEPPLQGPQGLALRPPADVYRILGRMVCGTSPEPSELPSLLDPALTAATGSVAAGAAAPSASGNSGSIAGTGTFAVVTSTPPPSPSHPILPLTSRLMACYGLLAECARNCAVILLDTSLKPREASPVAAVPMATVQLEATVRTASEQVVALVAAQGWDAGSMGRLPPGVALPLREAFQRCRASPPPGWPVQAYALIGREDIAATLAPSGLTVCGPAAAAADRRQQEQLHHQHRSQHQHNQHPSEIHSRPNTTHSHHSQHEQRSQYLQEQGATAAAAPAGTIRSAVPGASFASLLRHLPGLRTLHNGAESQQGGVVTPMSVTAAVSAGAVGAARMADGSEPNFASTTVGGGGLGANSPSSLFSFSQMPQLSLAAVTPSTNFTPFGPLGRVAMSCMSDDSGGPAATPAVGTGVGGSIVPYRPPPPPPPPRPPPSHLWHMWRPAYTARLQLPSHQLDLGAELEAPRKLEGPAKQFESKHGMEGLTRGVSRLRFGRDSRLRDVITALDSSHPLVLDGLGLHESDPDAPIKQQQQLLAAALRTMSLPLGRGAVALATGRPLPTEPTAAVPSMCLAGLVPDSLAGHTVVNLDLSTAQPAPGGGAAADFTAWPEFHNGAAEGLRLSAGGGESLSRTWLQVTTKPDVPSYTHAGLLMALGLTGHLDRLSWTDLYRYLSDEHDPTTIAVLVGMAAQRRGSMDVTVTRMLFLHLPARHPTTFPELELSPLVQAAALMGVGLLYEGSAHRVMAETLVEEIGRRPLSPAAAAAFAADGQGGGGPGGCGGLGSGSVPGGASLPPGASPLAVTHDREGYALAAGVALGMVVLGLGGSRAAAGLADLQLEERLTYYMLGSTDASAAARRAGGLSGALGGGHFYAGGSSGLDRVFGPGPGGAKLGHAAALWGGDPAGPAALNTPAAARSGDSGPGGPGGNGQGAALVVLEPDNMLNLSITSPAATVALALMYLRTNNTAIASRFQLPDTPFGLDCVRPDCITLRALGRALVMWDAIEPSETWLEESMPPLFRGPLERLVDRVVAQLHGAATGVRAGRGRGGGDGGGAYHSSDVHAVALAHVSALSGLCLAIGLKYAGSANNRAYETLRSVALALLAAKRRLPEVAASSTASGGAAVVTGAGQVSGGGAAAVGRLDRAPVEAALSVVVLALSVVMAGTGHLPTFHLLQALSNRRHPTHHHVLHSLGVGYGAHCAVSLALGFLFLGAGTHTFSTTNSAVAALLVALFPTLPHTPTDNRCHLQVFRHLYVLAARRRCLEAVDIDSQQLVYVPLQLMVTPPKVVTPGPTAAPAAAVARGIGLLPGHGTGTAGMAGGDNMAMGEPIMIDDHTVLKVSTKANLPWTPDGQLRPGIGPGSGAAAVAAAATAASGPSGSPPMLEALHLEGDSPGPATLLRATGARIATANPTPTAGGASAKPPVGSACGIGSPGAPDSGRRGTSGLAAAPFATLASGVGTATATVTVGQPVTSQLQGPSVGHVITYERVAPALLPEPHQTIRVAVRGPRYWPQQLDWSSRGATGADGTGAVMSYNTATAALFSRGGASVSGGLLAAPTAGMLGSVSLPQTPYGQFPFSTPMHGGAVLAGAPNLVAAAGTAPPAAAAPQTAGGGGGGANTFDNVVRGVVAPTAGTAGGCSALETVYRQLLLFVKKRAGSLSYSQDPSGIRSLLSRAFHNQGLLRLPMEHPSPCGGARSLVATAGGTATSPRGVSGTGVSPSSGSRDVVFGARRQLDWSAEHHSDRRAAPLGPYPATGGAPDGQSIESPSRKPLQEQERGHGEDNEHDFHEGNGSGAGNEAAAAGDGGASPAGDGDGGGSGGGFDLVHLCATFSVDPSIMAFAQHIKAMRDLWTAAAQGGLRRGLVLLAPKLSTPPPARGVDTEQRKRLLQRQRWQRRRHGADLLSFCYSALYECITGEKTAALPMYLSMHCLVHRAASWSDLEIAAQRRQAHGLHGPVGAAIATPVGAPTDPWVIAAGGAEGPTHPGSLLTEAQVPLPTALHGLQLARAYYSGPLAAAAAAAAAATAGKVFADLDEQALWRPLMQPAFLDSLWCTLQHRRWRPMGLMPPPGAASNTASVALMVAGVAAASCGGGGSSRSGSSSALEVYLRRGRMLSAADFDSVVPGLSQLASESELQAELAACLALHGVPPLATVSAALSQLRALPAWQQLRALLPAIGGSVRIGPGTGSVQGSNSGSGSGAGVRPSWALLPLLSLVLPGVSNEGLLLLAAAVT